MTTVKVHPNSPPVPGPLWTVLVDGEARTVIRAETAEQATYFGNGHSARAFEPGDPLFNTKSGSPTDANPFFIASLGCGYYRPMTRADVFGEARPVADDETEMGTLYHRCQRIITEALEGERPVGAEWAAVQAAVDSLG